MEKPWKQLLENERIKKLFAKENLIVLILSGILLMVIVWPTGKKGIDEEIMPELLNNEDITIETPSSEELSYETYGNVLEAKLQTILATMEGVGKVSVMLTFYSSDEKIILKDEESMVSEEVGTQTQSNQTNQSEVTVCYRDTQGNELPYQTAVIYPKVEGVVVVAEGANNPEIVIKITEVVQALFDIEIHKIRVVAMKSE